jgi:hypothetical protein
MHLSAKGLPLAVALLEIFGVTDKSTTTDRVVAPTDIVRDALEQALDCIRGETPEDCTPDEAREDTVQKVRRALKALEGNSHNDPKAVGCE